MMGVSYLYFLARKYSMPLVVCIPLGTNMGSHMGMSRLGAVFKPGQPFKRFRRHHRCRERDRGETSLPGCHGRRYG